MRAKGLLKLSECIVGYPLAEGESIYLIACAQFKPNN